jgi:hypothetical protein
MKKRTLLITIFTVSLVMTGAGLAQAHGGFGGGMGSMMGGYGYGPMMNGNGYGPMMNWNGYGSMMNRNGYGPMMGYGTNNNNGCWNTPGDQTSADINTPEKAGDLVNSNLSTTNDRLKVGKITKTEDGYEVQVVTKKGNALVDRLLVEQDTGRIYRIYDK